jgi:protocatechuate 3,4-dioxygenase alpha subunit
LIEIWQANAAGRYAHADDTRTDIPLEDGFAGSAARGRSTTDGSSS